MTSVPGRLFTPYADSAGLFLLAQSLRQKPCFMAVRQRVRSGFFNGHPLTRLAVQVVAETRRAAF
jgi:hypothetical protein